MPDFITAFDAAVEQALTAIREPTLAQFFIWISELVGNPAFIGLTAIILAYLAYRRNWSNAAGFLTTVIGSEAATFILKNLIARPRPELLAYPATSFAFPSGHSVRVVALFGFMLFLIWPHLSSAWKKIAGFLTALLILGVGFSRLYMGVHYASDVLAGYIIGSVFVWIGVKVSQFMHSRWS